MHVTGLILFVIKYCKLSSVSHFCWLLQHHASHFLPCCYYTTSLWLSLKSESGFMHLLSRAVSYERCGVSIRFFRIMHLTWLVVIILQGLLSLYYMPFADSYSGVVIVGWFISYASTVSYAVLYFHWLLLAVSASHLPPPFLRPNPMHQIPHSSWWREPFRLLCLLLLSLWSHNSSVVQMKHWNGLCTQQRCTNDNRYGIEQERSWNHTAIYLAWAVLIPDGGLSTAIWACYEWPHKQRFN
mgnify:CR=1 FL=1